MHRVYRTIALTGAALVAATEAGRAPFAYEAAGWSRPGTRFGKVTNRSIAEANRHTGKPHEHVREIARRQRQAAAKIAA